MIPRGFTRCDECEGEGRFEGRMPHTEATISGPCPSCSGSGLRPTEKLREEAARAFHENYERLAPEFGYSTRKASRTPWPPPNADLMRATADAVLRKVAEHIGEGR